MTFRMRLIVLVACLVGMAVMITTATQSWNTRRVILREAEGNARFIAALLARQAAAGAAEVTGDSAMANALRSSADFHNVWVLDRELVPLGEAHREGAPRDAPAPEYMENLVQAIKDGSAKSELDLDWLVVAAPIPGQGGEALGGVIIRFTTDRMRQAVTDQFLAAAILAFAVAAVGLVFSVLLARFVTDPVDRMTEAAHAVEERDFDPVMLSDVLMRRDEMGDLARIFQNMSLQMLAREERLDAQVRARTRELEVKNRELESAKLRIDKELEIAQVMQQTILPTTFPANEGWDGFASMTPAREVGGDFYDYFELEDNKLGVVVGDVSGKGVPAAFFMMIARTVIQGIARTGATPAETMARANALLCQDNPLELFVTAFYGILDARTGEFRYAMGGHNPPLVVRGGGAVETLPSTGGMALGVIEDATYAELPMALRRGDTLFLYTDGITEAFSADGRGFGKEGMTTCLRNTQLLSVQQQALKVLEAVHNFSVGGDQHDDLTSLTLRFNGLSTTYDREGRLVLELSNDLMETGRIGDMLLEFGITHQIPEKAILDLNLAIEELFTNTCSYGWRDKGDHTVELTVSANPWAVVAEMVDNARHFNPFAEPASPDLESGIDERPIGGLGLYLVRTLMDDVAYQRQNGRNRVTLTRLIGDGE